MRVKGQLKGIVGVDLLLTDIFDEVFRYTATTANSYAFVVNAQGRVLLHPNLPASEDWRSAPVILHIDELERSVRGGREAGEKSEGFDMIASLLGDSCDRPILCLCTHAPVRHTHVMRHTETHARIHTHPHHPRFQGMATRTRHFGAPSW